MWEKAFIGDDGPQVSRKGLFAVVRTNLERLEPMPFRTQLQTGYEGERSEMERWTRTPEGTWNVLRTFEETHAISARSSSTWLDRRQEKPHSVRFFCFIKFQIIRTANDFPQSLLDFLESRGMKRKSINHCAIRDRAHTVSSFSFYRQRKLLQMEEFLYINDSYWRLLLSYGVSELLRVVWLLDILVEALHYKSH